MGKVICKNCGFENTTEDIFCKKCDKVIMTSEYEEKSQAPAKKVEAEKSDNKKENKKPKKLSKKMKIIIAVASAVIVLAGVFTGLCLTGVLFGPELPENEDIILALNSDKTVTSVEINGKPQEFKVTKIEINGSKQDEKTNQQLIDLALTRQNDALEILSMDYTVVYEKPLTGFKYISATANKGSEILLKPLAGVDVETATKLIHKTYKDAKFDKQETDLEKGTDKVYFNIENDTNSGFVIAVYKFDEKLGWKFSKIDDEKLSFKPGVSHQKDGLYTNSAIRNIMFFGVDAPSNAGRSDCMMLVSIDTNTSKIKLTSFMRDTYVQIPGYGGNKLNSAFAFGGPDLAVDAIESTYGIKIDNYAAVNFSTFKNVINSLGGVNVNISADEAGYINWQLRNNGQTSLGLVPSSGGNVTLNGQQALWLCRDRGGNGFSGDDFVRTSRQRRVISSLISSYKNYSASQVLSTLNNLLGNVTTDLSSKDLSWLAENSGKLFKFEIEERCAPDQGEWSAGYSSAGAWIISVNNWDTLKSDIQHFIYEDLE